MATPTRASESNWGSLKGLAMTHPPLPVQKEEVDERGNGIGTCMSCKKLKRVWSYICGLCGECFE